MEDQLTMPGFALEDDLPERPASIGQAAVTYGPVRDILTKTSGFLDTYDYTLNPYSGCSFGCKYCFAAFFTRSDEERDTWGEWVKVKDNSIRLMESYAPGSLDGSLIYMSSVTDPYQPVERRLGLTRRLLEILAERHSPRLIVQTRSPDVVRDCDLFEAIERRGGRVRVNMTVTSDDDDVRRIFEPSCFQNGARLKGIQDVQEAGIEACVTMTPLLLVSKREWFVSTLLQTGVQNFIVQPFQFSSGKFIASTRQPALELMAQKLGCGVDEVRTRYMEHYDVTAGVLREHLPNLGEGKDGFAPPF